MSEIRVKVPIKVGQKSSVPAELISFTNLSDGLEHIALCFEGTADIPLVRIHSECLTGDVFNSSRCDCGDQLDEAIREISISGGAILYLRQEGRGIGLYPKIDAYALQDQGFDTYEANQKLGFGEDQRGFTVAVEMLNALKIKRLKLLTNNPQKETALRIAGIDVTDIVATGVFKKCDNIDYLKTKRAKKSHKLDV